MRSWRSPLTPKPSRFDGLRYDLLEWKDHVIRVMRNCILVDINVEPSAAQFIPDPPVSETVGRSRKRQEYVNGYDVIIALQRWRLKRGSFSSNRMEITVDLLLA